MCVFMYIVLPDVLSFNTMKIMKSGDVVNKW